MPLAQGSSRATISSNISEMEAAGHPHAQAVAAALHTADQVRRKRAEGGLNYARVRSPSSKIKLHTGPIHASVAGRTDHLPMHVPHGAYVLPADIVSGMGEGNTLAGFKIAAKLPRSMFSIHNRTSGTPYGTSGLPYGAPSPQSRGGTPPASNDNSAVPIIAAGGEHVYSPEECAMIGGGDIDRGHKILDEFVKQYRAKLVKKLGALPGPRKD